MENFQDKLYNAYQAADKGNFDHARIILEETLYEFPDSIEAWLLLADLADNTEEARQCYQMALEIDANNWVAQQRMKLLFSNSSEAAMPEMPSEPIKYSEEDFSSVNIFDELDEMAAEDEMYEKKEEKPVPVDGPTLKESFEAHKKLVLGVGGGVLLAFVLGVVAWILSIGFIAWRMGYLILGG